MDNYKLTPGKYPNNNPKEGQDEYFGNGWSVKRESNKFFLIYISGSLQGKLKTIEINEDDFISASKGELNIDQLCTKYNAD